MRLRSVIAGLGLASVAAAQQDPAPWTALLQQHCAECHDADARKGGLDLAAAARGDAADWLDTVGRIRDRVAAGEMPPPRSAELPPTARATLVRLCGERLRASVPLLAAKPVPPTIRRLSRTQWDNVVRDLFGVRTAASAAFPTDDLAYGFDTIGDALSFSTLHLETYLAAAEAVAAQVFHGEDPAAPPARRIEAERMQLVRGAGAGMDGDVALLYTNAAIAAALELPRAGDYRLRIAVGADPAGDEPAQLALGLDGRALDEAEVRQRELRVQEWTLPLTGGAHRVELAFVNDYWDPDHPDPTRRDRNLRIDWLECVGPIDPRPTPPQQAWLAAVDRPRAPPGERLRAVVRAALPRVWRRSVRAEEIERVVGVGAAALARGEPFHRAAQQALVAMLASPGFLLRPEPPAATAAAGQEQLAVRWSFFLWSSGPDDELRQLAAAGGLAGSALRAQLDRMLTDPRAEALATDFAAQWLELRALADRMPDPARFPGFDEALRASMRRQTELLVYDVLRERRDVRALLDSPTTHVDARLAAFYGLVGAFGPEFVRVELPPEQRVRGGLLGHASMLALTSNPSRTSPVKRGKWVLQELLGQAPPPPPPGQDSFADEGRAVTPSGMREQLRAHRADPRCAACHLRMDEIGFALEGFDAIGRRRERDASGPIDARGALPDGAVLAGPEALAAWIGAQAAFPRTVARKLFVHAAGREPTTVERLQLDLAVDDLQQRGGVRFRELVERVALDPAITGCARAGDAAGITNR